MVSQILRRASLLAAAGSFALAAFAGPSFAYETDPSQEQFGFTGRYLLIIEDRRGRPSRIKTFDPLTLQKKVVFTARRSTDFFEDLTASAGNISFVVTSERRVRSGGRTLGSTTQRLVTVKDDGGTPIVVETFKYLTSVKRFCGSMAYNTFLANTGAHYVVEHKEGRIAANGKRCAQPKPGERRRRNLLRFDDPFAIPVVRRLKADGGLPSVSRWPRSIAPDGGGYAFQNRSSIAYYDMASGLKRVITPQAGRHFEEFMLGPGKRMVATERDESRGEELRFLYFPNIDFPEQRIELTNIKTEILAGRFCGSRPLVIDQFQRYYLFDDQGHALSPIYTAREGTTSTPVGCTGSSLVLAIEKQDWRGTLTWEFAPLSP